MKNVGKVRGVALLPLYIYYLMFAFRRIDDLIWAAADQRARGFLIGATSCRTTLGVVRKDAQHHLQQQAYGVGAGAIHVA